MGGELHYYYYSKNKSKNCNWGKYLFFHSKASEEQLLTLVIIKWQDYLHGWAHINHFLLFTSSPYVPQSLEHWEKSMYCDIMLIVTPLSRHSASRRWRGWGADWFPHRRAVSFSSRNKDKCKWISWQAHLLCISLNLRHTEHLWALKVQNNEVILWLQHYASVILHIQEIWLEKNQCNVFYLLSLLIHALILHLITLWFVLICLFVFLSITNTIMFNCTYIQIKFKLNFCYCCCPPAVP